MQLTELSYSEYEGKSREWKLHELALGSVNLLVGKNATGKSRTLNVIAGLAKMVSGRHEEMFYSGTYDASFRDADGSKVTYQLSYLDKKVQSERFVVNGDILLERRAGGEGEIYMSREKRKMEFHTPDSEIAVVARRDKIQHPFFNSLYRWGETTYHYVFSSSMGHDRFAVLLKGAGRPANDFDDRDPNQVVSIFIKGRTDFKETFRNRIKSDMAHIGYYIEDVDVAPVESIIVEAALPGPLVGLTVKEVALKAPTDQFNMSRGMFRALSIIVQVAYATIAKSPTCIAIDDIGEGLDFERASKLVELLIARAMDSQIQLIMATNDRFIMNKVPLEYWSVLHRTPDGVKVFNHENSKAAFEAFQFTGLNNFDFFATDFVSGSTESQ